MAKKSFKKNAQNSLGGFAILQNTTKQAEQKPSDKEDNQSTEKAKQDEAQVEQDREVLDKKVSPTVKKAKPTPRKKILDLPASEKGCKDGDTRKTFIIKKELAEKMMDIAYWEPGKLKDHMNAALEAYTKKKWTKKRPKDA